MKRKILSKQNTFNCIKNNTNFKFSIKRFDSDDNDENFQYKLPVRFTQKY